MSASFLLSELPYAIKALAGIRRGRVGEAKISSQGNVRAYSGPVDQICGTQNDVRTARRRPGNIELKRAIRRQKARV